MLLTPPLTKKGERMASILQPSEVMLIDEPDLLHVTALTAHVELCASGLSGGRQLTLSLGQQQGSLLACHESALRVTTGEVEVRHLGVVGFAKLLAFIDGVSQAEPVAASSSEYPGPIVLELAPHIATDPRALEYWFIGQLIKGDAAFGALTAFLRRLENYWLIKYLVSESALQKKVSDLGEEYGLSYSHFRRVCKAALGNSVKSELKAWRAARSLLDVVGGRHSMTEAAIKNGYASSSHFSTEIKNLFGLSPRAILELNH
jgi:AraC-like DNA-binding protein